ncbi:hypothetical protein PsYK624_156660 [Phanerochaete sordida]|uniref:Transmembrane protein n=1 Tax=Phanerochaete sordida TaxID=48140 RepID=A0A9P3GPB0_9APHY|nr:hypothetical protein PsYK624_156660 [Phanerochaete sordida]
MEAQKPGRRHATQEQLTAQTKRFQTTPTLALSPESTEPTLSEIVSAARSAAGRAEERTSNLSRSGSQDGPPEGVSHADACLSVQLAEAILEDGDETDEVNSIVLDDTHSRMLSDRSEGEDHERQFLVRTDEDEEREALEDDVQSFRSSVSMDTDTQRAKADLFMHNTDARRSHLNVDGPSSSRLSLHVGGEEGAPKEKKGESLAAKAGIILGIHNIFVVISQFLITGISSTIFALTSSGEADERAPGDLPANATAVDLVGREGAAVRAGGPDSYAYVFRLGGLAAACAFVLTVRHLQHHERA